MWRKLSVTQGDGNNRSPKERILIAEDDSAFRKILARRAKRMGLSVVEAEDGQQAIDELRKGAFDLMLLDLHMPNYNGLEVVQAAQEIDSDLQAVILTAGATIETAVEALRAGVYDYLTKPLESLAELELTLNRALEHRRLIKENTRLFAEVQRLAVTDALTGLCNRHKFDAAIAVEVERARRYGRSLSLIMVDLDGLKGINDRYGHPAGDKALKLVAEVIQGSIRTVDLPVRIGGDEFLVMLPEADLEAATLVAQRMCGQITSISFQGEMLSVSAGVAQWSSENNTVESFIDVVDQAMYQSKRAGGRRIFVLATELSR
jgi:diguanylate cyclase (GGDEF)-like protein